MHECAMAVIIRNKFAMLKWWRFNCILLERYTHLSENSLLWWYHNFYYEFYSVYLLAKYRPTLSLSDKLKYVALWLSIMHIKRPFFKQKGACIFPGRMSIANNMSKYRLCKILKWFLEHDHGSRHSIEVHIIVLFRSNTTALQYISQDLKCTAKRFWHLT